MREADSQKRLANESGAYLVLAADPPRFTIIAISEPYLQIMMLPREKILARGLFDVLSEDRSNAVVADRDSLRSSLERVVRQRVADTMPVQRCDVHRLDGSCEQRCWRVRNVPLFDAEGLAFIIHRLEDVTADARIAARMQTRADAKAAEREAILAGLADGVLVCDTALRPEEIPAACANRHAETVQGQALRIQRDGEARRIAASAAPLVIAGKHADGVEALSDLTRRKQAEDELRATADTLRLALDAANLGTFELDLTSETMTLDRRSQALFGLSEDDRIAYRELLARAVHFEDRQGLDALVRGACALPSSEACHAEFRSVSDGNIVRWIAIRARACAQADREGRCAIRLRGTLMDITAQKSADRLRKEAEAAALQLAQQQAARAAAEDARRQVTTVLESISDAFFAVDADWRFTYVNGRAEQTLGRRRKDLLGKVLWDVYPASWDSPFGRGYREALNTQEPRVIEGYSELFERWFEVHIYPSADGISVYFHDVTERKNADAMRREGEQLRRALLENSMDAVLLTSAEGRIVMANSASQKLLGYSEAELRELGRSAVLDESDPQLIAAIEERSRTGQFRGEITMKRKGGERFPVELTSSTFRDENGVVWTSKFIRDISERKAQEAERERLLGEIEAKRRWLQMVLENVPVGVVLIEPDHRVSVNRWTEQLFGMKISPQDGSAQYANRILYPDGQPVPREELVSARVLRTGETILSAEFLVERSDGTRLPILGSAVPMRDGEGKVIGGIGVFQDVSERMKAEAAVRANERLLDGIFDLLPVGLFIADHTGLIIRANSASQRIWGGVRYVGLSQFGEYKAFWADGRPIAAEEWALARAVNRGETSIGEILRIQAFDGTEKTILNSALPLYDERGGIAGAVVVNEDITKLKQTEEQLQIALKLRDEVIGIVAHDLRNPLNAILLMTRLLLRRVVEEKQREPVQAIVESANQINALIRDLLDVARLEGGRLVLGRSSVEVAPLIEQVLATHQPLVEEAKLQLQRRVADGLPRIDADPDRLVQVLSNLLGNSMKFTPEGGTITIAAEQVGPEIRFSVEDTGSGISEEQRAHIFDRFWQANRNDKRGAGLGLSICKGLVEAHGGRLWVESEPDHGSAFRFTIPIAA